MNRTQALDLIEKYCTYLKGVGYVNPEVIELRKRWPLIGTTNKAMRWLGFIQGFCYGQAIFSLDQLKQHSKYKKL